MEAELLNIENGQRINMEVTWCLADGSNPSLVVQKFTTRRSSRP